MGIKQFLEQQGEQPVNIRDIRIEAIKKKKELRFDPETEITESDWRGMKEKLETFRGKHGVNFSLQAMAMKILCPERVSELNLDADVWRWLTNHIVPQPYWADFSWQAMTLKILFPEKVKMELAEKAWRVMKDQNKSYQSWENFTWLPMAMKILCPDKVHEMKLDDAAWQMMKDRLERFRGKDVDSFLRLAMHMKILYPARVSEMNLNNLTWREMKKKLELYRQNQKWFGFAELAMAMKILAAHRVEVTDNGLEITMRDPAEDFREEQEPMPVRLSF